MLEPVCLDAQICLCKLAEACSGKLPVADVWQMSGRCVADVWQMSDRCVADV